jgi:AcrR family transcriptional regulator
VLFFQIVSATKRKRADGERSRAAILEAATKLATLEGLDGLSIGRLAEEIGMSKSGLYAHFGSKEDLQLAAIDTAVEIVRAEVILPAREPDSPLARLESLCEHFLAYLEKPVFPGGCFFASAEAELDTHPGPVREKLVDVMGSWLGLIERRVRQAQEAGEIDPDEDPALLAFELDAFMKMANSVTLLRGGKTGLEQARRAIRARLDRARNDAAAVPKP